MMVYLKWIFYSYISYEAIKSNLFLPFEFALLICRGKRRQMVRELSALFQVLKQKKLDLQMVREGGRVRNLLSELLVRSPGSISEQKVDGPMKPIDGPDARGNAYYHLTASSVVADITRSATLAIVNDKDGKRMAHEEWMSDFYNGNADYSTTSDSTKRPLKIRHNSSFMRSNTTSLLIPETVTESGEYSRENSEKDVLCSSSHDCSSKEEYIGGNTPNVTRALSLTALEERRKSLTDGKNVQLSSLFFESTSNEEGNNDSAIVNQEVINNVNQSGRSEKSTFLKVNDDVSSVKRLVSFTPPLDEGTSHSDHLPHDHSSLPSSNLPTNVGVNCEINEIGENLERFFARPASDYIVDFYDAFSNIDDGGVALMMEYMDGGSLQDIVEDGGCADEVTLANIAVQGLIGLAFLHRYEYCDVIVVRYEKSRVEYYSEFLLCWCAYVISFVTFTFILLS